MPPKAHQQKDTLIESIVAVVQKRLPKARAEAAETFIRLYYRNVPPDDMAGEEEDNLYGAALGLWQFGATRKAGEPKIRVYNPQYDEHGWHANHTVVEIVNDDMPFLVDSVTAALNELGLTVHLVVHPLTKVTRDASGQVTALNDPAEAANGAITESFMHIEVDEQTSTEVLDGITQRLTDVLRDTRHAVEDWKSMRERMADITEKMASCPPIVSPEETEEAIEFLRWMDDDHFTYLGYREYAFENKKGGDLQLMAVPDTGLGILRDASVSVFEGMLRQFSALPPDIQQFVRLPRLLMVTKGNRRSTVHRPVHLDVVVLKVFDDKGEVTGERMFVGLFTSVAYNRSASDIPFLRRKVSQLLERAGFESRSHDGKALTHILDTYPRDELFQSSDDELLDTAMGVLHLQERQRTALFVRLDPYQRFASCLVYTPRERYNTDLRKRFSAILEAAFNGTVTAFYTQFGEGVHARVHYIVKTNPGDIPEVSVPEIEAELVQAGRTWSDLLQDALIESKGEESGLTLFRRFGEAFPTAYRESTLPQAAIFDIGRIDDVIETGRIGLNLYRPIEAAEDEVNFKLYHDGTPLRLSDVLPMMENMGLHGISEHSSEVRLADREAPVWVHDFEAQSQDGAPIDLGAVKKAFQQAFFQVWEGEMEDDGFNRLVLKAGLQWREVTVLRAYGKYLRQARFPFGQDSLEDTLAAYPHITRLILDLFSAQADPSLDGDRAKRIKAVEKDLRLSIDEVANLDEDMILRRYINLVRSTLRTNFFQPAEDGGPKPYISMKLDSERIDDLPLPRPWREIFVYSPRVEAVHLRGGPVARGGIRWSDRRQDFRTEILGLMKSQMVKNGVIVPVGSKGGFVVKRPPREGGREAFQAEGIACYQTMMRGMLDVTDNLSGGDVVPPKDVVRHDGDDPYLVVAADKGTATFSDIANGISVDYGHWLGDAYASGGSDGYDHKKMGITARGAWESVKRHFREMGTNTQEEEFTVIGVGDMSGDVFGNGMLLSEHIRLLAAFNHLHIFIDPDPDAAKSFKERQRLFEIGRGSWDQYDSKLISKGGGVFERSAKSIDITPEMRKRFGIEEKSLTPNELLKALLLSEMDLLWFGGIGTYIKATSESHAEAGDKANDAIRINGREVRAKVIGEGANLGVTQRGRIEFARIGGRMNTDFIDNSAGVDCSDHEVNIKILLNSVVDAGDMTVKQRNALLEKMTDEVAALCLRDNYLQTQTLTMTLAEGPELLDQQARFMRALEKAGQLNRAVEMLPDDEELTELLGKKEGLSRPETAVLLSYAKITLYDDLLQSDLPDDETLASDLVIYFPKPLQESYRDEILRHPLRREIIATFITNSIINRTGPTYAVEMADKTGMGPADIARAYIIIRDSFGLRDLWRGIEALDNQVDTHTQTHLQLLTRRLVERTTSWVLRNTSDVSDIGEHIAHMKPAIESLYEGLNEVIYEEARKVLDERTAGMVDKGVPEDLARKVSSLNLVAAGCDLIHISDTCQISLPEVGPMYFDLGRRFGIAWLRDSAIAMPTTNHWQKQAVAAIVDDLYGLQSDLTIKVLDAARGSGDGVAQHLFDTWVERRHQPIERIDQLISELKAMDTLDLSMLAVANRRLRALMAG